jgi:hypothetical protein
MKCMMRVVGVLMRDRMRGNAQHRSTRDQRHREQPNERAADESAHGDQNSRSLKQRLAAFPRGAALLCRLIGPSLCRRQSGDLFDFGLKRALSRSPLALNIGRIVRAALGAMDQEIVHLIQLRLHQDRAASPAGVVDSVAAGLEDRRGTQHTSHARSLDSHQRNLPPLSHYVPYAPPQKRRAPRTSCVVEHPHQADKCAPQSPLRGCSVREPSTVLPVLLCTSERSAKVRHDEPRDSEAYEIAHYGRATEQ